MKKKGLGPLDGTLWLEFHQLLAICHVPQAVNRQEKRSFHSSGQTNPMELPRTNPTNSNYTHVHNPMKLLQISQKLCFDTFTVIFLTKKKTSHRHPSNPTILLLRWLFWRRWQWSIRIEVRILPAAVSRSGFGGFGFLVFGKQC